MSSNSFCNLLCEINPWLMLGNTVIEETTGQNSSYIKSFKISLTLAHWWWPEGCPGNYSYSTATSLSLLSLFIFFTFFPLEDISLDFSYPKIREKRKLSNVMLGLAIHLRKFQNVRYYIVIYAIYWPFSGGVIPDDKNYLLLANKNSRYFLTH